MNDYAKAQEEIELYLDDDGTFLSDFGKDTLAAQILIINNKAILKALRIAEAVEGVGNGSYSPYFKATVNQLIKEQNDD